MHYFRLMNYYVHRDALSPRTLRRYQRNRSKWWEIWMLREVQPKCGTLDSENTII